jgi:GTP-binding protein HflX
MRAHRIPPSKIPVERALLVGVTLPRVRRGAAIEYLRELDALARTAGAEIVGTTIQNRTRIDGSTFIGAGKLDEIAHVVHDRGANLVIFDDELSPAQARNIEKRLGVNVIDRTELILDIFARRARTKQAKIQVEIAQLRYTLPRLRRLWEHLERQEGGIGTRGPGETQIEVDRRRAYDRMANLSRELERIHSGAAERRKRRSDLFNVTIVGYTNAGKSTLFNRIAGSEALESARLFSTLDSTTRRVQGPSGEAFLLTDTIGFIRKLPAHLVASFRATLLDVSEADLLLHVVDATSPYADDHVVVVNGVLESVLSKPRGGAGRSRAGDGDSGASRRGRGTNRGGLETERIPTLLALNQVDLVENPARRAGLGLAHPGAVLVSAVSGEGVGELLRRVEAAREGEFVEAEIAVAAEDGRAVGLVESTARVLSRRLEGGTLIFIVRLRRRDVSTLERAVPVRLRFSSS